MFARLGDFVARNYLLVILTWIVVLITVRAIAPRWDDVTFDGDLAFLPEEMPSVVGQRLTERAFPRNLAKSQIALIVARHEGPLQQADLRIADALAKRFHNLHAAREISQARYFEQRAKELAQEGSSEVASQHFAAAEEALQRALEAVEEALRIDDEFAWALHNRGLARTMAGHLDLADQDCQAAWKLKPELRQHADESWPPDAAELPLVDVWTRHNEVLGDKLRSEDRQALLVILQLSNEFMATDNIRVLQRVERELDATRYQVALRGPPGLTLGLSGSAAVGGDMLRSAAESIRNTEVFTIFLVVTILLVVYRAPLLVTVPLVTISVSLMTSTSLLAMLTQLNTVPGFEWWGLKVFKTTKIFIIVILFGAGTDFCLFLIARFRELLDAGLPQETALSRALAGVGEALTGSALTTILGLAMMFFADFGKFRNSGPAIGLCLGVTLVACLTLAPALLRAFGPAVFWPSAMRVDRGNAGRAPGLFAPFWRKQARLVVLYPGRILTISLLALLPFAVAGWFTADHVTFDLLSAVSLNRPSRKGAELLKNHFPIGEGGPIMVLAQRQGARFDDPDRKVAAESLAAIYDLTKTLRTVPGVETVRSLAEPLGDPPQRVSLVSKAGRRKLMLREHRLTKSIYLAQAPGYSGNVTRFEIVMQSDPFSKQAIRTLARVDAQLQQEAANDASFWHGAEFVYAGTTAGIRDLQKVTRADNRRIQILVVVAVFGVLLVILRRPLICLYLILSVLLSYLVTIGLTELFFAWLYGDTFQGLDWKVPIFLFVILVAVGEDYNIYLVTRVFQEQALRGPFAGLREAILRTGGIITSCGIIMAGTFISMTTGSLRGMVELGFALSLGVLLDTFIVRTLLVPSFLAACCRWQAERSKLAS
jgi:RND superfamily putative drug exporter